MNSNRPPTQLENLLLRVLSPRDRETIAGDLIEDYREHQAPRRGGWRADLWYARQLLSIVWVRLLGGAIWNRFSTLLSAFTLVAGGWLLVMELVLQHDGYIRRSGLAMYIAFQSIATLLWLVREDSWLLRRVVAAGTLALLVVGLQTVGAIASASHFEGFAAIIGVTLTLQSVVTLAIFCMRDRRAA